MPKKDQQISKERAITKPAGNAVALTVDEARDAILALISTTAATENIAITEALGRTISSEVHATTAIPPFKNSAMDGFAIRYKDTEYQNVSDQDLRDEASQQEFKIIGKSLAGHPFNGSVSEGEAVRITTGAAIPKGADAIVIQELATIADDTFRTSATLRPNQYIRHPGDDIESGQQLIAANTKLTAAHIGLLAAQGISHIAVFVLPKVGIFSTGDELRTAKEKLNHGEIFDSNRATIQSVLLNAGIDSIDLGICKDDPKALEKLMKSTGNLDFVLSSGGVSVGEADHIKDVLEANGELLFWKVAMKPGKPLVSGKLSTGAWYFGLPGNPVSSMVTCVQFVIPAIRAFSGLKYSPPLVLRANCLDKLSKEPGRFEFQRGIAAIGENGEITVSATGLQDSHVLSSMSKANCFICLDQFATGAEVNEKVAVILFHSLDGL